MTAYYNEIDPYAAQWLRNLIQAGHIAPGVVDERSIEDVHPSDLRGFTQCHFFAGIGVWSLALRRAGWPDDRPVWTGSCPCQPFSSAGKGAGFADERHLWPAWFHLIRQCRPPAIRGEQVASSDGLAWLDLVLADLESEAYACGAFDLCAAGVGAPHIRQRLWIVANATSPGRRPYGAHGDAGNVIETIRRRAAESGRGGAVRELGDTLGAGLALGQRQPGVPGSTGGADAGQAAERAGLHAAVGLGDAEGGGRRRDAGQLGWLRPEERLQAGQDGSAGPTNGLWRAADWLACRDSKWRPVEPGTFPLAHGATARVGRLRAYGNAINAEAARVFIEATM